MAIASAATAAAGLRPRSQPPLLRLQPDLTRDLAPQVVLRLREGTRLIGGAGALGEEPDDGKLLLDLRVLEDLVELLVHPGDRVGRRPGRRRDAEPADHLDAREGVADR